jgi:hypothetical protein
LLYLYVSQNCTKAEYERKTGSSDWNLSREELLAFIGLLFIRGATAASKLELESLWSNTWGLPIFKDTMSRNKFRKIMAFLRFDEKSTRSERIGNDKFCMISEIWDRVISNGRCYFSPSPQLTVDEQLLPSKTRCPYTQYIPTKPDKFGIKFWVLCDRDTKFVLNIKPYLGKDYTRAANTDMATHVVMDLVKPYYKGGYNITCDNFFTSAKLADELRKEKCSMVGTVRKHRKELPRQLQAMEKSLSRYETKFLVCPERSLSLTVYKCKPTKAVCLLSTLHRSCGYGNPPKKLPDVVYFYNNTKYGVDIFDGMVRKFTTKAGSRRWPMHVFYNLLDISGLNSYILYKKVTKINISRRDFLLKIGEEMCRMYCEARSIPQLPPTPNIRNSISQKRRNCQISTHHNKTTNTCSQCGNACCGPCTGSKVMVIVCKNCNN